MNELEKAYETTRALEGFEWDHWTEENLHSFRPRHLLMATLVDKYLSGPRNTIADVGCHNAFFLRLSSHLGFKRFIAVDYFPLPPPRSFLRGLEGAEFQPSNFNEAGFLKNIPSESIDCLVSTEVFEHLFNHPFGYLEECWRVLRPGGVMPLTTPHPATLVNAIRLLRNQPIQWGAVAFAETVKVTPQGLPEAMWDIHFREYFQSELRQVLQKLPNVEIAQEGFIGTGAAPRDSFSKRIAKSMQWMLGLGHSRLLSTTQYWILKKKVASAGNHAHCFCKRISVVVIEQLEV